MLASIPASAQVQLGEGVEVDKSVHNFGDINLNAGPVSCTFTITNTSKSAIAIYQVITSCGCTDVSWTKEPIVPGKKGKISVTYSNDEGPYPFDKTLTVYISNLKKPVLLKIRGVSVEVSKPLEERYPEACGPFALQTMEFNCGNVEQGNVKTDAALVANLSYQPLEVNFKDISENLSISVTPNPIPARSTAEITFTVNTDREVWGKNDYWATPVIKGKSYDNKKICIKAFTRENFDKLNSTERSDGPRPMFEKSTYQAGMVKHGEIVHAEFIMKNEGKKPFGVYKVDIDAPKWAHSRIPVTQPGKYEKFTVDIDTSKLPKGEMLVIVTMTTNSPLRPIVNLFIAGWIE